MSELPYAPAKMSRSEKIFGKRIVLRAYFPGMVVKRGKKVVVYEPTASNPIVIYVLPPWVSTFLRYLDWLARIWLIFELLRLLKKIIEGAIGWLFIVRGRFVNERVAL